MRAQLINALRAPLCAGLLALPLLAAAQWTGKGEAGGALSTANTGAKTTTLTAKFDLAREWQTWKQALGGAAIYTSAKTEATVDDPDPDTQTSAKRWELHEQSDYKITPTSFWFGAVRHEDDDIGSFAYQTAFSTGFGHRFIDNDTTKLFAQIGGGYKRFKIRIVDAPDEKDSDLIGTALLDFQQVLSSNTSLINKLAIESGSSNTFLQEDFSLQVKMIDVLALAVGYQLRYNTKPGVREFDGHEYAHSDRLLTLNLVYEIK